MPAWHNRLRGTEQHGGPALVTCEVKTAAGAWVDVARDVLHPAGGVDLVMAGKQTELDTELDDAQLSLVVNSMRGDYTPGYSGAAVSFYRGMPIRVRETIGRRSEYLFNGTMNQPEAVYNPAQNDATVVVTAVDWSGAQQQGPTFISTLGEYIRYAGRDTLVGYWPLTDPAHVAEHIDGSQQALIPDRQPPAPFQAPQLTFGGTAGPRMDDGTYLTFDPLPSVRDRLATRDLSQVTFAGHEMFAVSLWYFVGPPPETATAFQALVLRDDAFATDIVLQSADGLRWSADITTDAGTVSIPGDPVAHETWQLLTVLLDLASGTASFMIDRKRIPGSLFGASTGGFDSIVVDAGIPGTAAAHVQLYLGDAADVSVDAHIAQYEHGMHPHTGGLRFQRTDERIRTLARYGGLADGQLDLDAGCSYMSRASLAGKTFRSAAAEVVATEQGRLFSAGNGNLTFHNRSRTRYAV
jgi:hypothetical protein